MKYILFLLTIVLFISSCDRPVNKEAIRNEIMQTEKAFEQMASGQGVAAAFHHYADDQAVIKRENDTLIIGKEQIKKYYEKRDNKNTIVQWTPDFIEVADCGTLAYTYGKYSWKLWNKEGDTTEYKGVFHTIWKKQEDKSWKYVWD